MKVLICDDTEMMQKTLQMFLEKQGHEVVAVCSSGEEVLEKYPEVKPDVCLLDIAMPGIDGITTLRRIRKIDPDVKAIMCTGRDDNVSMIQTIQVGALDYIAKPFTPQRLEEALKKLM